MSTRKFRRFGPLALMGLLLSGCGAVDQFGSRALVYNEQASTSKSSGILLNVLRAAHRQPLQFTDLSTVTGVATSSATLGSNIPIRIAGPPFTAASAMTLSPSTTISGGPTFNVANLNTKEFYQGLQSPLEPQILANYVEAGVPLKLLLLLYISEIEVLDKRANRRFVIQNSALTPPAYYTFLTAIDGLVEKGLSIEPVPTNQTFGPVLTGKQASNPVLLAGLAQAMAAASGTGGSSPTLYEDEGGRFQLNVPEKKWRFCFNPYVKRDAEAAVIESQAEPVAFHSFPLKLARANDEWDIQVSVGEQFYCGSKKKAADKKTNIRFKPRSLQGIFLYLGDMVRAQLGLGSEYVGEMADPNGGEIRLNDPNTGPRYLFKIERRRARGEEISASFDGAQYALAVDPSGRDASSQVIQILTDLLALKSSAKSLPAPSVISVVQ